MPIVNSLKRLMEAVIRRDTPPPVPMSEQVIDAAHTMIALDRELAVDLRSVIRFAGPDLSDAVSGVFEDLLIACERFETEGHLSATDTDAARSDAADIRAHIDLITEAAGAQAEQAAGTAHRMPATRVR